MDTHHTPPPSSPFSAIYLGFQEDMDTAEFNYDAENAGALVGTTFGDVGDPLLDHFVTIEPDGYVGEGYDQDTPNGTNEKFTVDGAGSYGFDSVATFHATLTYVDGTTATITAVVFQDVDGRTYLAPEMADNADQAALEAKGIRSLTLDSLEHSSASGLATTRADWDYAVCFTHDTLIDTINGPTKIQDLKAGDLIRTADHGYQPLRWHCRNSVPAKGALAPILIPAGALGNARDLRVSPQHRMLLSGWQIEVLTGEPSALAAATHLVDGNEITVDAGGVVHYYHLLFDGHEIIYAEGIPTESFHPGVMAWNALTEACRTEIFALFPDLLKQGLSIFGDVSRPVLRAHEVRSLRSAQISAAADRPLVPLN